MLVIFAVLVVGLELVAGLLAVLVGLRARRAAVMVVVG
jgi:hypothetical protein